MSRLAGIVLAAGTSSRFGTRNKLLAQINGQAMVRGVVEAALATELEPVIVVTGHQADAVREVLAGLEVVYAYNAEFADGQSGSLKTGIGAVPPACAGAMILLGDMPEVGAETINQLLDEFIGEDCIVVPQCAGRRGNPVILGRKSFTELETDSGDEGARRLLAADNVRMIDVHSDAVLRDFDTPESLEDES